VPFPPADGRVARTIAANAARTTHRRLLAIIFESNALLADGFLAQRGGVGLWPAGVSARGRHPAP
jgi:hypothetical protein